MGAAQAPCRGGQVPPQGAQGRLRQPDQGQVVLGGRGPFPHRRARQVRHQPRRRLRAHQARHQRVAGLPLRLVHEERASHSPFSRFSTIADPLTPQRTVQELGRRCSTLVGLIAREAGDGEDGDSSLIAAKPKRPRKTAAEKKDEKDGKASATGGSGAGAKRKASTAAPTPDVEASEDASRASTPAAPAAKKARK